MQKYATVAASQQNMLSALPSRSRCRGSDTSSFAFPTLNHRYRCQKRSNHWKPRYEYISPFKSHSLSLFRQNQQHRCFVLCVRSKLQLEIKAKLEVLDPKAAPIFVTARISRNSFNVPMFEFGAADTQIIRGKVLFDRQYVEYLKYLRAGSRPCASFFPSYSRCMSMPYW